MNQAEAQKQHWDLPLIYLAVQNYAVDLKANGIEVETPPNVLARAIPPGEYSEDEWKAEVVDVFAHFGRKDGWIQ